jgi:hypothetical protein
MARKVEDAAITPDEYEEDTEQEVIFSDAQDVDNLLLDETVTDLLESVSYMSELSGWQMSMEISNINGNLENITSAMEDILRIIRTMPLESEDEIRQIIANFIPMWNQVPSLITGYLKAKLVTAQNQGK